MDVRECLIIGGGVAGLSAAIHLAELGIPALVLEAGKYPGHRICGEFFSPECLPILARWGIELGATIEKGRFVVGDREISFALPQPAGGFSRYLFDMKLLEIAQSKGATVRTEASVSSLRLPEKANDPYEVELSDGSIYYSQKLMIGTGRLPNISQKKAPVYAGFKSHFEGIASAQAIEMHCFDGGYVGISPVAQGISNVAALVRLDRLKMEKSEFMEYLQRIKGMEQFAERLKGSSMLFTPWMMGQVPEFGIRHNPSWPNVYWIGDAAGSIPPICGDGLGIALTTGLMAADYLRSNDPQGYQRAWHKRYHSRFFWGKWLHSVMTRTPLSRLAVSCCQWIPSLPAKVFALTRE
ncbi:MAG: NAD(P)/FAD-dependent oxidoreductase [Parachlamydia sp.]|nr:NAD(P)/FAD-dependent oxidoreductase [Parachlamydia sp.]